MCQSTPDELMMVLSSANSSQGHQVDVAGVLQHLLIGQQRSALHFLAAADPYVGRASSQLKRKLQQMIASTLRREGELAALLEEMGADVPISGTNPEHQYMAFLSFDYLLPKLREDKARSVSQYEAAAAELGVGGVAADSVARQLEEHRAELAALSPGAGGPGAGGRIPH